MMTIAPTSAAPGQDLELRFPADSARGIGFSLSAYDDGTRTPVFYLTSDWGRSDHVPAWWSVADSEDRGWEQVLIDGEGPDRVVVPGAATPGEYVLCTANARDEACAMLTVTD